MTVRECQLAAYWRIPVTVDGIPFRRIQTVAINFRDPANVRSEAELEPWHEVILENQSGRGIAHASPKDVQPREPETFAQRVAEYNKMKAGESIGS